MRLGCHKRKLKISICLRFKYQCYNNVGSTNVQISILNWIDWWMGCHKRKLQISKFDLFDLQISMFKYRCSNINVQISMFKYQCSNINIQFVWVESGMRLGCHKRNLKISICLRFKYQCYDNVGSTNVQISILNWFDWRMVCQKRKLQISKFDLFDLQISMFKYRCSNINVQISMFKYQCSNINFQFVWVESGERLGCHKRKLKISMINLFEVQISMFKYQCSNINIQISMFKY